MNNQNIFLDRYGDPHEKPAGKEVLHRDSVYGVAIKDGNILLVKAPDFDFWVLPGGGVDEGESIEEGLKREFLEETGFTLKSIGELFFSERLSFYAMKRDLYFDSHCKYFFVELRDENQDMSKLNPEDSGEIQWYDLQDLDLGILNHASRRAIDHLKKNIQ